MRKGKDKARKEMEGKGLIVRKGTPPGVSRADWRKTSALKLGHRGGVKSCDTMEGGRGTYGPARDGREGRSALRPFVLREEELASPMERETAQLRKKSVRREGGRASCSSDEAKGGLLKKNGSNEKSSTREKGKKEDLENTW